MKTHLLAAAAIAVTATPAITADFPFVGKWNYEISGFTFTNRKANNGSETFPILKVEKESMFRSEKGAS